MKKTFAALTLATIMMFGSTLGFAEGIIISDGPSPQPAVCTENRDGIIIFSMADGIIIFGVTIIAGSENEACRQGIIVSD